jgi:tetratricopeptide (TPR) repeat protein
MTRKTFQSTGAGTQRAEVIASTLAMGRSHHTQGHLKLAEDCYRRVLALDSNNVDGLHLLGVVALQSDAREEAIKLLKRAQRRAPAEPAILVNLGAAYRKAERLVDARDAYHEALKHNPNIAEAHFNLGKVLFELDDIEGSMAANKRALALAPNMADAWVGLGNALKVKGDGDAAIGAYKEAIKIAPTLGEPYGNISAVLFDRTQYAEALDWVSKGVALHPQPGELRFKRALMALRLGEFEMGWPDYESRFFAERERVARFQPPPPYWNGEDISDKRLLVWTEQGLGDEVLYSSMLSDPIAKARSTIIECSPRMVPVFARSFPSAKVVRYVQQGEHSTPADEFDRQISVVSLGQFFRRDFASFPRHRGYMKSDAEKVARLRTRYQATATGNLIVGLSWRSKNDRVGELKSADLSTWRGILQTPGVTFVNLQYGDCRADLRKVKDELGVEVIQDPEVDPMKSMDDCFAQVAAMDLVISTSNTTAHVAGSQDVPVWVLLNSGAANLWYWFLGRNDSPWYPSARLYRNPRPPQQGDAWWCDLTGEIAKDLAAFIAKCTGR